MPIAADGVQAVDASAGDFRLELVERDDLALEMLKMAATPARLGHFSARIVKVLSAKGRPSTPLGYRSSSPSTGTGPIASRTCGERDFKVLRQQKSLFAGHPRRK